MKVEPTGVVIEGKCEIQSDVCQARVSGPVTILWTLPQRSQVSVCQPCLEEQVRAGEWEIAGAKVKPRLDAAVYDSSGRIRLAVEVKSRPPLTDIERWARKLHRNLIIHSALPSVPYFMLVSYPNEVFLWTGSNVDPDSPPDFRGEADLPEPPSPDRVTQFEIAYEQLVARWLERLTQMRHPPKQEAANWVRDSGLFDAIRGGTVVRQATVSRIVVPSTESNGA
jgi:hypothetical protein